MACPARPTFLGVVWGEPGLVGGLGHSVVVVVMVANWMRLVIVVVAVATGAAVGLLVPVTLCEAVLVVSLLHVLWSPSPGSLPCFRRRL